MEKRVDYRKKMAIRARKQKYAKIVMLSALGIVGTSVVGATQAQAEEWLANTPESIQIEQGATSYTMKQGDTLWAIATRININVNTLAQANNIDLQAGQQYHLAVGTVISWTDKVVTATDANGTVIGQAPITESSKIVKDKAVGENVQQDVVNGNATDKDVQGGSNQTGGNTSNSGNTNNGGSQGGGQTEGNGGSEGGNKTGGNEGGNGGEVTPPEGGNGGNTGGNEGGNGGEVTPPTEYGSLTIGYLEEGTGKTLLDPKAFSELVGTTITENAPAIDGYEIVGQSTFTTTITGDIQDFNFIYRKVGEVTPPTDEFYVGQVLHQSQNFATPAEAELHMYDIAGTWYAYADAHGIDVDINAEGGGGAYYVKVVVTAVK